MKCWLLKLFPSIIKLFEMQIVDLLFVNFSGQRTARLSLKSKYACTR